MQIVKNFIYNVSYQLLVIILPLITVPYVSNILGAEGIGNYAFTYANMQYFIIFGMVGISIYGNRNIAYVRDNKEKLNTFSIDYTDNEKYWGSNQTMENSELTSYPEKWHNKDNHIRIKVPPLGATFIKGKELKIDTIQIDPNSKVSIGGKDKKVNKVNPKTKTQKL